MSAITAGYILCQSDHVTLFEADGRLGGHADTHLVVPSAGPPLGVDTGFIVYNEHSYPLLTRLSAELGVGTQPSHMSMSVRCAGCGLQYAGQRGLAGLAAGLPRGRGRYLRLLAEVPRFHRAARRLLDLDQREQAGQTLGDFLRAGGFSGYFAAHFALPLVAAVWSCPPRTALRYPARYLFAFLAHHGMLSVSGSLPWRTVTGGSRGYVERAARRLHDIRLGTPVCAVRRHLDGIEVCHAFGESHRFDAVVVATHPDQALRLLDPPTEAERDVLGAFSYTENPAILHTDAAVLPRRRSARASWSSEALGDRADLRVHDHPRSYRAAAQRVPLRHVAVAGRPRPNCPGRWCRCSWPTRPSARRRTGPASWPNPWPICASRSASVAPTWSCGTATRPPR